MTSNSVQADPLTIATAAITLATAAVNEAQRLVAMNTDALMIVETFLPAVDPTRLTIGDDAAAAIEAVRSALPTTRDGLRDVEQDLTTLTTKLQGLQQSLDVWKRRTR